MKSQKGFTVESLLILIIFLMLAGTGFYVYRAHNNAQKTYNSADAINSSTVSVKKDPTADWVAYSNKDGQFSLKYPKNWVQPTNQGACTPGLLTDTLYLGPDKDSVLKCGSDFFGQVSVTSKTGDLRDGYNLSPGYKDIVKKNVTVAGVTGFRISGVSVALPDAVLGPVAGTIQVDYAFYTNGRTYGAAYTQAPKGSSPSTDVLSDFDLMVTKTLKFSAN